MLKRRLVRRLFILLVLVAAVAGVSPTRSTNNRRCSETFNERGECIWLCCPVDGSPCHWSYC